MILLYIKGSGNPTLKYSVQNFQKKLMEEEGPSTVPCLATKSLVADVHDTCTSEVSEFAQWTECCLKPLMAAMHALRTKYIRPFVEGLARRQSGRPSAHEV